MDGPSGPKKKLKTVSLILRYIIIDKIFLSLRLLHRYCFRVSINKEKQTYVHVYNNDFTIK